MNTRKSLAKVFGPVLLLTGALALPMDLSAAPQHDRGAAQEKAQKNDRQKNRQKAKKQQANQQRRQAGAQRQKAQPQKQVNRQRQANRQKANQQKATRQNNVRPQQAPRARQKAVRQQQSVRRQEARKQVVHQQAVRQNQIERQRQAELQRQATLQRQARAQRQANLQRQAQLQRQAELQRQARARRQANQRRQVRVYDHRNDYRYNGYRSGGGGGADRSIFHIDGHLTGGRDCMLVRDHDGRTWALVGDTYGLQGGEHVRLYGRIVDGGACGYEGTAFDVYEVRTVWADQNHKRTYYDHLYDGPYTRSTTYEDEYYDDAGYYENDAYYEDDRQEQGGLLDSLLGAIRPPA